MDLCQRGGLYRYRLLDEFANQNEQYGMETSDLAGIILLGVKKAVVQAVLLGVSGGVVLLPAILLAAGTLWFWQGWVFGLSVMTSLSAFNVLIAVHDPEAIRRRSEAGARHESQIRQKIIATLGLPLLLAVFVLPALDFRFGWSSVPWPISIFGEILVFLGLFVYYRVVRTNSYAAASIQVEEGQSVISTGPYATVRHPMYAGALVFLAGTPIALGSLWALLMIPVFFMVFAIRIRDEERILKRDLNGYADYVRTVRWRLLPGVY